MVSEYALIWTLLNKIPKFQTNKKNCIFLFFSASVVQYVCYIFQSRTEFLWFSSWRYVY